MSLHVGKWSIEPSEPDVDDARGVIWLWEDPQPRAQYVLGIDPTVGITGWHRSLRTEEDEATDNGAITVLRVGSPDVQVAEFAAPIDPYELATVCNFLGRLYAGSNEDGQALCAIEVYPGPGWATQTELINRYGYYNLPPWRYEDGIMPKVTRKYGWFSSRATRRDLWIRGAKHINERRVIINSPWLIEEMVDCVQDNFLAMTARARSGAHDDRVVAKLLSIWYAHEWSLDLNPPEADKLETTDAADFQCSDMSLEGQMEAWQERFSQLAEE